MRRPLHLLLLALLLFCIQPAALGAQRAEWQEHRTRLFSILYPAGAEHIADSYAQFVDDIYEEASTFWSYRPPGPVILRIYPTLELYYEANPIAAQLPGVVAHAHTGRREISVAIPQTEGQSDVAVRNNIRHELTHIIAADLSAGRLTLPWQEGIAQYVEHPDEQLTAKMALMRQIIAENRLLSWRDLNQPGATYADPRIGYPETFTIAAFLVQRNGIERFRTFVEAMKESSGYRGALQVAYGTSADALEREWRAQLDDFVSEGYKSWAGTQGGARGFDLTQSEALLARGDYAGALASLQALIDSMADVADPGALERARSLFVRAQAGQQGTELAANARDALARGDYHAATAASAEGRKHLWSIGQREQADVLAEYEVLARRGMHAEIQMSEAGKLLRRLRVDDAQALLVEAYTTFGELGDMPRTAQARSALSLITRAEQVFAGACFAGGAIVLAWSGRRRLAHRQAALPWI